MMVQRAEGSQANIHHSVPCLFWDSPSKLQMVPFFSKHSLASAGWILDQILSPPKLTLNHRDPEGPRLWISS